jgi:hypothetical protein
VVGTGAAILGAAEGHDGVGRVKSRMAKDLCGKKIVQLRLKSNLSARRKKEGTLAVFYPHALDIMVCVMAV